MRLTRVTLADLPTGGRRLLTQRSVIPDEATRSRASAIVTSVREGGDEALVEAGARFGGSRSGPRRVAAEELDQALDELDPALRTALEVAVERVTLFHRAQAPSELVVSSEDGVAITRTWSPLRRVGAYVPGGKAAYPSTLIMTVVPAFVAGVEEVVVASPAADDGSVPPVLFATAALVGVTELHVMGGAQAIAALAYGTQTLEAVQKIVGPGNRWVTAAKLAVFGDCAIDLPAGPSEALVLADATSNPRWVAVDMLCQAEHGPDSPAVLVTTDPDVADAVEREINALLPGLKRSTILEKSLVNHGLIAIASDRRDALMFVNEYAPEHVSLATEDAERDSKEVVAAGSVYVGAYAAESAGDYATGANHVLPTGGLPATYGPLSLEDFGSWRQVQRISKGGLARLSPTIETLAAAEGLTAHGLAAAIRFETERPTS